MTEQKWVSVWGNAVSSLENKPEGYAKDITLRIPVLMSIDGSALRFTFDNFAGTEAITLSKVTVAKYVVDTKELVGDIKTVWFDGKACVEIAAKEKVVSDAIDFVVCKGEWIAISVYLGQYTQMKNGVMTFGPLSQAYYALGNQTEARVWALENSRAIGNFYFMNQIDVLCEEGKSILCFGDSITAQAWPEFLQLYYMETDQKIGIVRRGVCGARVLREYRNLEYEHYGIRGDVRFEHEAQACGADTVIILQGINDIIHPVGEDVNRFRPWSDLPTSEELIEGLRGYIQVAKERKLKVYMGTIMPVKGWRTYADFRNDLREEVNAWIRNTDEIDGFIDFDKALQDDRDPHRMHPLYDSGDHLHPNDVGHKRIMEEIVKVIG